VRKGPSTGKGQRRTVQLKREGRRYGKKGNSKVGGNKRPRRNGNGAEKHFLKRKGR